MIAISDILAGVKADAITLHDAGLMIQHHTIEACEDVVRNHNPFVESPEEQKRTQDDFVRNGYIQALLKSIVMGADSENVAVFVWDVAQRLMDRRERNVPMAPILQPPAPPETLEAKVARLEAEAEQHRRHSNAMGQMAANPITPAAQQERALGLGNAAEQRRQFDPRQNKGPWTTPADHGEVDNPLPAASSGQMTDGEHDDGPF